MTDLPALRGTYLPAPISEIGEFAMIASRSGMFGTSKPEELIVKLMAGASWGVPPMAAMTDVYVVKGKPMASGTLLRSMIRASGRYDYRVTDLTDQAAEIEFMRLLPSGDREVIGASRFTIEDAKRAGYTSNALYTKTPKNMLLARATSDGVKAHCPDVFMGSIYAEGEIEEEPLPTRRVEPTQTRLNLPGVPWQVEAELVDDRPQPETVNDRLSEELRERGRAFRSWREDTGFTMGDLAEGAGLSVSQVSGVEVGRDLDAKRLAHMESTLYRMIAQREVYDPESGGDPLAALRSTATRLAEGLRDGEKREAALRWIPRASDGEKLDEFAGKLRAMVAEQEAAEREQPAAQDEPAQDEPDLAPDDLPPPPAKGRGSAWAERSAALEGELDMPEGM